MKRPWARPQRSDYYRSRIVAVSGAASGLGRALALALATEGAQLVLLDRNEKELAAAGEECRQLAGDGQQVTTVVVDVADESQVSQSVLFVEREVDHVDVLINNAGILASGTLRETDLSQYRAVMDINFFGVVSMTKAFLPMLTATVTAGAPRAHVVNVSSAFGLITAPGYSAYSASKFAVRALSEALSLELARDGIVVTSVLPGGLRTGIARSALLSNEANREQVVGAFDNRIARTEPADAAISILNGVASGVQQVTVGSDARVASALARGLGSRYVSVLSRYI